MSTLLIIAAVWLVCGTLFFLASMWCCREFMPEGYLVGFLVSQLVWVGFVYAVVADGVTWLYQRLK